MVFVMRTAFCRNRLLHKYFVESAASPSRLDPKNWRMYFLFNVLTDLQSKNGIDLVFKVKQFENRYAFRLVLFKAGGGRLFQDTMRK